MNEKREVDSKLQYPDQELYDKTYFDTSCGIPYTRENLIPFFHQIALNIKDKIKPNSVIDIGCAKGFLVECLRDLSIDAYGIDISDYALHEVRGDIKKYCKHKSILEKPKKKYDLVVCIEVLEHLKPEHAEEAVKNLCNYSDDILFASTPTDKLEKTHHNVRLHEYWIELFAKNNFYRDLDFDCSFITPYAIRLRKTSDQVEKVIKNFEQKLWQQREQIQKLEEGLTIARTKIDEINKSDPLSSIMKIYQNRPDLQNAFSEAKLGNLKNLLKWAIDVNLNEAGNLLERTVIEQNRLFYKYEFENMAKTESTTKLIYENQQQESQISKLLEEKQQQDEFIDNMSSTNKELESDLITAHKVVQEREHEKQLLKEEISVIKQSISWSIILKLQKLLSGIFPPNTRRGTFLFLVLQFMRYSNTNGIIYATRMAFSLIKQRHTKLLDPNIQPKLQLRSWKDLQNFNELDIDKMKKIISAFKIKPKISIIMPVFNVDEKWLRIAIDSVRRQVYENWELCIVDDASTLPHIKPVIMEYGKKDPRIKIKFLQENKNIASASNEALNLATGDYVGLLDHDDEIYQNTLFEVVKSINENPDVQIIYSDENHISPTGERIDPFFKPDYSPDLLMTCHYMVHFIVYATSLLRELNGFRVGFDGAQDYDLVLRAVEKTNMIHHIPKLLYGWRNIPTSTAAGSNAKSYAPIAAKKALEEALKRRKINGTPQYLPDLGYFRINYNLTKKPLVSIIITTRDRPDLLSRLLSSIERKTTYENYEIIVVDHLSKTKEALEFFKSLKHKVIRYEKEFNISNLFNFAEKHANGEYLLTMNDDLEVITENWIESMLGPCQRDEVGIVGAQLIYPDASAKTGLIAGQTIQHAGVVLGVGGIAGHAFRHIYHLHNGYFGFNKTLRNYSAVTGACMLVKRDVYKKVNGYDPIFKVAYGDVDFCLRVRKEGYLIVYTPYAKLYHYEGGSRGIRQPSDDAHIFVNRWKNELLKRDPYYNVNLTLLREDFSLSFSGIPIEETPLALLMEIYANRQDLQKSFPEAAVGQYENLITWAATYDYSSSKFGLPNDTHSHILTLYQFWYKENSGMKSKVMEQKAV